MLYGRLILVNQNYYNKIIDINEYSFFVSINSTSNTFIKIKTSNLDKKNYVYTNSIIEATSNLLTSLIPLKEILLYSPFVNKNICKKKKYYKKKNTTFIIEKIVHTINFD